MAELEKLVCGEGENKEAQDLKAIAYSCESHIYSLQANMDPATKFYNSPYMEERDVLMLLREPSVRLVSLQVVPIVEEIRLHGEEATAVVQERLVMVVAENRTEEEATYVVDCRYEIGMRKGRMVWQGKSVGPLRWEMGTYKTLSGEVTRSGKPFPEMA